MPPTVRRIVAGKATPEEVPVSEDEAAEDEVSPAAADDPVDDDPDLIVPTDEPDHPLDNGEDDAGVQLWGIQEPIFGRFNRLMGHKTKLLVDAEGAQRELERIQGMLHATEDALKGTIEASRVAMEDAVKAGGDDPHVRYAELMDEDREW